MFKDEKKKELFERMFDPNNYKSNSLIVGIYRNENDVKLGYEILKDLYCNSKGYWKLNLAKEHIINSNNYYYFGKHVKLAICLLMHNYKFLDVKKTKGYIDFKYKFSTINAKNLVRNNSVGFVKKLLNNTSDNPDIVNIVTDTVLKHIQPIAIKEDKKIKDFLHEIRDVKKKYLKGNDDDFINMINDGIYTGLELKTLRKYYYES